MGRGDHVKDSVLFELLCPYCRLRIIRRQGVMGDYCDGCIDRLKNKGVKI